MRITDVRTVLLTGPSTDDPYTVGTKRLRTAAFVEIHTDTPHVGIGETYLGYFFPEIVPLAVEYLKPILVNADTFDIYTLCRRMRECCIFWGRVGVGPAVISGIEAALWDLRGKLLGLPVYELLGGQCHEQLLGYASGGTIDWPRDAEALTAELDFYLGLGFRAIKIAVGFFDEETKASIAVTSPSAVAELVASQVKLMRNHVGKDVRLLLDAHQGFQQGEEQWSVATATAVLKAVEPYDISFFEEPLPYIDPRAYGGLSRSTTVPVAGGEQLTTVEEFRQFADHGAFVIAQPDASWVSMSDFVQVGQLFASRNGWVASHCWGAGAAVMQNVHASFATPNAVMMEMPPAAGALHRELWGDSLQVVDGMVLPPAAPGLGVTLTDELKARYPYIPGAEEFVSVPGKVMQP